MPQNNFIVIPECITECRFLTRLNLDNCKCIQVIRGIPPNLEYFSARECLRLTYSCRGMLLNQELHEAGNTLFYLPGVKIPQWFQCWTYKQPISFRFRNKFPALVISVVMKRERYVSRPIVIINGNRLLFSCLSMAKDHIYVFDQQKIRPKDSLDEPLLENEWNHAEIIFEDLNSIPVPLISGIHISKQQSSMEDIQLTDPFRKIFERFVNLTTLNFDMCQYLTHIPNVSCLQLLENLSFRLCQNLLTIHYSVGLLEKLNILNVQWCSKLKSFPPIKLTSLEQLKLDYCDSLEGFPEVLGQMENITRLNLTGTPIKKFPLSFRNLSGLQRLYLDYHIEATLSCCDAGIFLWNISMMPELTEIEACSWDGCVWPSEDERAEKVSSTVSSNVQHLSLQGCNLSDDIFPIFLQRFANLKELNLSRNNFTIIPECIKEWHFLTKLNLNYCDHLREIRGIPPNLKYFSAVECRSLTSSCKRMLLN